MHHQGPVNDQYEYAVNLCPCGSRRKLVKNRLYYSIRTKASIKKQLLAPITMPDPSKLSTASGQLGPVCAVTGKALTFGEAIVLDGDYLCIEAYIEKTGASPSTEGKEVGDLDLD